jgi:hypothetical protein
MVLAGTSFRNFRLYKGNGETSVKPKWKIAIGVVVLVLIAGGVTASVKWGQKDLVTVQTGLASKSDLTSIVITLT